MSLTRIATYCGAFLLAAFFVVVVAYGQYGAGSWVIVAVVLVLLIVAGSRLYGRQSRYGDIAARKRPAQEAHDRAADLAADARRATAEAAKLGERYCPLDPAFHTGHHGRAADANHDHDHDSAAVTATNGHVATRPVPPQQI
jgi:hypothetical protein